MITRFTILGVAALFALSLSAFSPAIAAQSTDMGVTAQADTQVAGSHSGAADTPKKKKKKKGKKKKAD